MKRPLVVNKYRHSPTPNDVYIGRGSRWGNPYSHMSNTKALHQVATREQAIKCYRTYIGTRPDLLAALPELAGRTLVCYCAPLACHGDVLADLVEALVDNDSNV